MNIIAESINLPNAKIYGKRVFSVIEKEIFLDEVIKHHKMLIAMNARKIITKDEKLTQLINENIAYPDGKSVVMGLRKKRIHSIKYPGFTLWYDLVNKFYKTKTFYFIGSKEEVIQKTVKQLKKEFDGIQILGYHNGYLDDLKKEKIKKEIQEKKPDVVFVAMGTPIQEYFMNDLLGIHKALYIGLGGSFDVYVGNVKAIPLWWEKYVGNEGLYRVLQDPKKLKRQINVIKFLNLYFRNKL